MALTPVFSEVWLRPAEVDRRGVAENGPGDRATLRARLSNSVVIELDGCDAAEDRCVRTLIDALAGRPCSGSIPRRGSTSTARRLQRRRRTGWRPHCEQVAYKGTGPALTDVMAGRVPVLFCSSASIMAQRNAGRVKVFPSAGSKRSAVLPEVLTVAEAGYSGYSVDAKYGMFVPAETPSEVAEGPNAEVLKALALPDVKQRMKSLGLELVGNSAAESARRRNTLEVRALHRGQLTRDWILP